MENITNKKIGSIFIDGLLNWRLPGMRLKEMRKNKKWTQETLAEKIGVSVQQIRNYEKGTRHICQERAEQFGSLFQCDPNYFLDNDVVIPFGSGSVKTSVENFLETNTNLNNIEYMKTCFLSQIIYSCACAKGYEVSYNPWETIENEKENRSLIISDDLLKYELSLDKIIQIAEILSENFVTLLESLMTPSKNQAAEHSKALIL